MRLQLRCGLAALAALAVLAPASAIADDETRVGTDTLVYTDTDNVVIVTPQVSATHALDEDGGLVSARVAVDVISAASVDVVSQATTRFSEVRTELGASVSKSLGFGLPALSYRFSTEPDYVSHGGRLGLTRELRSSDTILTAGYGLTSDAIGRSGTPFSTFSESLLTHSADISLSQVFGVSTVGRFAYTLTVQDGYMEKPYRYVPVFTQASLDRADASGTELGLDNFADFALTSRPPEEVPDLRYRHAFAVRLLRAVPSWSASLKLDYQIYADSWGVIANLVEPALRRQFGEHLRARAFVRVYHQTSADFWRRTYVSDEGSIPRWRTMDRSLTSYLSGSGGGRVEVELGALTGYLDLQAMWTRFSDYLLLDSRLALVGQMGVRWTL